MKVISCRFCLVASLTLCSVPLASNAWAQTADPFKAEINAGARVPRVEGTYETILDSIPVQVEVNIPTIQCGATITASYLQSDTLALVETELENSTCVASHGTYGLTVSVRDASGERQVLQFEESWQRSEPGDLKFSREYPIGENVDLLTVRARTLQCICDGE